MGTTLREVIYDIGGGIRNGRDFKAVQIGGPSGGCLTKEHLDLPLDFDSLKKAGAIIGSGGLVVMDEDTCMVEVARFFMSFTQKESCGKCVPCREGTKRMLAILERIVAGQGKDGDIEMLLEWRTRSALPPFADSAKRPRTPSSARSGTSGTNTRPISTKALSRGKLPEACKDRDRPRPVQGLLQVLPGLPRRRDLRRSEKTVRHRPDQVRQVRRLRVRLPVPRD
jgi:hypothetical protein